MRLDPSFYAKVILTKLVCLGGYIGELHWERLERECVTDVVDYALPTLEDLGVTVTAMEDQVPWEFRSKAAALYHERDMTDFGGRPVPPPTVD